MFISSPSSVTEVSHILASASLSAVTEIFTHSYIHALTQAQHAPRGSGTPCQGPATTSLTPTLLSLPGILITSLSADDLASQLTERTQDSQVPLCHGQFYVSTWSRCPDVW